MSMRSPPLTTSLSASAKLSAGSCFLDSVILIDSADYSDFIVNCLGMRVQNGRNVYYMISYLNI